MEVKIKAEIIPVLEGITIGIEHVGSTSVQGVSAKPIIDIDVVIKDHTFMETVLSALEKIGYQHEGDLGIVGVEVFKYDGKPDMIKFNIVATEICKEYDEAINKASFCTKVFKEPLEKAEIVTMGGRQKGNNIVIDEQDGVDKTEHIFSGIISKEQYIDSITSEDA